ncbi:MAG: alpha/beta hydrolase [Bacteroidia bacterium]
MKSLKGNIVILSLLFMVQNTFAQTVAGNWNGALEIGKIKLRIVFHITENKGEYNSTMDSPDQGAKDLPVGSTTFKDGVLTLKMPNLKAEFVGNWSEEMPDFINGTFTQRGKTFELNLARGDFKLNRPQEPKPPYKYFSEDVAFENTEDNVTLAGTLTKPKRRGKYKAVVMVSGSGPQNRDEEMLGHKPFLVIADYLTKAGYAVLRYDDRGVGGSTGDFSKATTFDLARDANAAVEFLSNRKDITEIGIIGHSEGGLIAPMVASNNKKVKTIVMLAGPGIQGGELLKLQQELIATANGESENDIETMKKINVGAIDIITNSKDYGSAYGALTKYFGETLEELPDSLNPDGSSDTELRQTYMASYGTKWMFEFIRINPADYISKLDCSVLALFGGLDLQVPSKENSVGVQKAKSKAPNSELKLTTLSHLNHLFQECETGSPSEYSEIEETFSSKALKQIELWLNQKL